MTPATPAKTATRTRKASATASDAMVLKFTFERETKNTRRYSEDGDEPVVGTIYIGKKSAEALGNPEALTVTITPV